MNRIGLIVLILGFSIITSNAQSQSLNEVNASLRGLQSIEVIIDGVNLVSRPVDTPSDTPDPSRVKAEVERQLSEGGIKVQRSGLAKSNLPVLHVLLNVQKDSSGMNYFSLRIRLIEKITLERNPTLKIDAATWFGESFGSGGGSHFYESVICEGVASFIRAYDNANGKAGQPIRRAISPCQKILMATTPSNNSFNRSAN